MDILVTKNNVQIDTREIVHEGEYNVNTLFFTFTQDYDGLSKMAVFSNLTNSYELAITNNMCLIPAEIVADRGCFTLGVYAYTMVDDEIVKRYSPTPIELKIDDGSYVRALNPQGTEPTLFQTFAQQVEGQFDEMSGAIGDNTEEINDLKDRATALENGKQDKLTAGSHITINNNVISSDGEPNVITKIQKNGVDLPINNKTVNVEVPTSTNELINNSGYITKKVNDLTNYLLKVNTGATLEATINNTTYVMTLKLKNSSGIALSTQTIDLPLETMVINASYDSVTKEIVLYLKNGNTVRFSVADLIDGLQKEITPTNKLSSDLVDDTNKTHKFVTKAEKAKLAGIEAGAEVNVIEKVKVNGEELPTENKSVNIDLTPLEAEITALKQENAELLDQIPTATAEGEVINVQDSSNLPIKDFSMSGNATQETNILTYKCDGTETGDYYFVYDNTNYQFTMPTISAGDVLAFNTTTLKLYQGTTQITTTKASTGTLITLNSTPSPDSPQDIHVVTGDVDIEFYNRNHILFLSNPTKKNGVDTTYYNNIIKFSGTTLRSDTIIGNVTNPSSSSIAAAKLKAGRYTFGIKFTGGNADTAGKQTAIYLRDNNNTIFMETLVTAERVASKYIYKQNYNLAEDATIYLQVFSNSASQVFQDVEIQFAIEDKTNAGLEFDRYQPPKNITLNLGGLELAKIGDYQDVLFKNSEDNPYYNSSLTENAWYKYGIIQKTIISLEKIGSYNSSTYSVPYLLVNKAGLGGFSSYLEHVMLSDKYAEIGSTSAIASGKFATSFNQGGVLFFNSDFTSEAVAKNLLVGTVVYIRRAKPTYTPITDTALITALEQLVNSHTYKNISNIFTVTDNAIPTLEVTYRKDLETMFDNLTNAVVSLGNNT